MDESLSNPSPQFLVNQIAERQENIVALRNRRSELEEQLAEVNQDIDDDLTVVAELQDKLQAAISSATHRAVEG